jgi:hypothetical protein
MSISFSRTREQLRSMVLRKLGVAGASTSVVSTDAEVVYEAIDLRLKEMHRLGIFWRKVDKVPATFSLAAGVATAHAATNDILFPILMTVTDGSLDEPLQVIGVTEYARIENKGERGIPTKALWKGSTEFAFHPVPYQSTTAKIVYEKIADDTSAGSAPDVEVSMLRSLKDVIAYDIGDDFGLDEARMLRFQREAMQAEKNIRKLVVERKSTEYRPVSVDDWGSYDDPEGWDL